MKQNVLSHTLSRLSRIGSLPEDSEEIKLQKSLLVICSFPFIITGTGWGIMYVFFGEEKAALIPLLYSLFSLASILYFAVSRKFQVFRFSQITLILLLPFALMLTLGGFINGSVVIIWSLISPLGALLFYSKKTAPIWLFSFIALVIISLVAHPWLRAENNLTESQILLFFAINLIAVGSIIFLMVYYFVSMKNLFQARSESLLLNILPREIAEELKAKGTARARQFDHVTVLFTDFRNFTKIAEKLSPVDLVAEIDTIFRAFDQIINRYAIEKIKTIGDAYMCAGGLPIPNTTHAYDVVAAALDILEFMRQYARTRELEDRVSFEVRIGVNSGPVVAGIVGEKKFAYDIWGDTVNIASRMESSGEAGKINISGSTYELIKDRFCCRYRGRIEAKNKGEIDMYFVEGALPEPPAAP
jgi:guanylate cyclase